MEFLAKFVLANCGFNLDLYTEELFFSFFFVDSRSFVVSIHYRTPLV